MLSWRSQRGDTLVEVVMAAAILSVVLATSFNIASLSFRLGVQARERSEAVRLVQEQAERLHLYRDQLASANASDLTIHLFDNSHLGNCATECRFDPTAPVAAGTQPTDCALTPAACQQGIYHVAITATPTAGESVEPTIKVSWTSILGGEDNVSQVKLFLADKRAIQPRDCSVAGDPACQ